MAIQKLTPLLPTDLQPLTTMEEVQLLRFYQSKVPEICRHFKFPPGVAATAHWLLARLSLRHSHMGIDDPKHSMLAAVLLATKCHNLHLTMEQFSGRIPNTNSTALLRLEFVLLSALEYRVNFFSPMDALAGFLLDYRQYLGDHSWDKQIPIKANDILGKICGTDSILFYTPARLAIIALCLAIDKDDDPTLKAFLTNRLPLTRIPSTTLEPLETSIANVKLLLSEKIDTNQVKAIDRRLIQIRKSLPPPCSSSS